MQEEQSQMEMLEISLNTAKDRVAKMESLNNLVKNEDFINIIDTGYFKEEASNVVLLLATPGHADEASQKRIMKNIDSIGFLRQYFSGIIQLGMQAHKAIKDHEEMKDELIAEGEV